MSQKRLNGLALINVHYNMSIDYEIILNIFAQNYRHRLLLIDITDEEAVDKQDELINKELST